MDASCWFLADEVLEFSAMLLESWESNFCLEGGAACCSSMVASTSSFVSSKHLSWFCNAFNCLVCIITSLNKQAETMSGIKQNLILV
jgi:hypothetical protein